MNKKDLFKNHNNWVLDAARATNREAGVALWIADGALFFDGSNGGISFGIIERHFLWRHFQKMCLRKALGCDE